MKDFAAVFGGTPEAVADAPGRVNLLGEHTDYSQGYVLPAAIPQRTRVAMRRTNAQASRVYSADLDEWAQFTLDEAPQKHFACYVYGCVRLAAGHTAAMPPALDIHIASDVTMGVGLSSSAALEVATLRALRELFWLDLDDVALAQLAQRAEIEYAGVNCGILDQMASSLLAPGSMLFLDTRSLERRLMALPQDSEILVVDSGLSRSLAGSKYNERRAECEEAARQLGLAALRDVPNDRAIETLPQPLRRRARHVFTENQRVLEAVAGVTAEAFGALMNASHASLRDDFEVSVPDLDSLTEILRAQEGVLGAKLTGAGFGGACVALCRAGWAQPAGVRALEQYNRSDRTGRVLVPAA